MVTTYSINHAIYNIVYNIHKKTRMRKFLLKNVFELKNSKLTVNIGGFILLSSGPSRYVVIIPTNYV